MLYVFQIMNLTLSGFLYGSCRLLVAFSSPPANLFHIHPISIGSPEVPYCRLRAGKRRLAKYEASRVETTVLCGDLTWWR